MRRRAGQIDIERVHDDPTPGRYRVLVDRLWPRGISKQQAGLDEWLRDVAPSSVLRRWYGHEPARFAEFTRRYHAELDRHPGSDAVSHLLELADAHPISLVTATRDVDHSGARALHDHLSSRRAVTP